MYCPKCNLNTPTGQFCSVCGTTLLAPPAGASPTPVAIVQKPANPKGNRKLVTIILCAVAIVGAIAGGVALTGVNSEKDNKISVAMEFCDLSENQVLRYGPRHVLLSNEDFGRLASMEDQGCVMEQLGGPTDSYDIIFSNYELNIYRYGDVKIALDWNDDEYGDSYSTMEIWVE